MNPRSMYRVDRVFKPVKERGLVGIVAIADLNGAVSVTNDAENVVAALENLFPGYRVLYRDSMGFWDEMLHEGPHFMGFAGGRALAIELGLT